MKIFLKIILILISFNIFGQNGATFKIEKLSKPTELLRLKSYDDVYKTLILSEADLSEWEVERNGINFNYNILAKSKAPDSLVSYGYNSFFYGMYEAYAEHRPFVLSPDIIWLLISQGFARHVNANPEELRKYFVDYSGKVTLIVESTNDLLNDSIKWEEIFPQITSQIAEHTGEKLLNTLTSDFSTTTEIEKVASEITIMEAMEPYFEYVVRRVVCGIPEITLLGTTEDWQKLRDKTRSLGDYDLKWWTNELDPILKEFVHASMGEVDKKFWRNMFKYHSQKQYGAPKIIDGWIVRFFPYDKEGKRNNLNKLIGGESLPQEMVKVDLKYIKTDGIQSEETMLELWAGFIGLEQNPETFALTPKISWLVKKKDIDQTGIQQKLELQNSLKCIEYWSCGIEIRITDVPENLKKFSEIYALHLYFNNTVSIPVWLKDIRIGKLLIEGKITDAETRKIINWFPKTDLFINGKAYNTGKNGWITVSGNQIPEEVLALKEIWILEIRSKELYEDKLIVPDALKNIKIANLTVSGTPSPENIAKLLELLPETNIFINGEKINSAHQ